LFCQIVFITIIYISVASKMESTGMFFAQFSARGQKLAKQWHFWAFFVVKKCHFLVKILKKCPPLRNFWSDPQQIFEKVDPLYPPMATGRGTVSINPEKWINLPNGPHYVYLKIWLLKNQNFVFFPQKCSFFQFFTKKCHILWLFE
jgi:hypothetical protein